MYIIPEPGVFIRDPVTKKQVPPEGLEVVRSTFWNRRVRDLSVKMYFTKPPFEKETE